MRPDPPQNRAMHARIHAEFKVAHRHWLKAASPEHRRAALAVQVRLGVVKSMKAARVAMEEGDDNGRDR